MAKITNKADLVVGSNLIIDEANRTIGLLEAGSLVYKDGVAWQILYSKLIDLWTTAAYQDSPFPLNAIDAVSGQYQIGTDGQNFSGWTFANTNTRNALRDAGWSEFDDAGNLTQEYAGFIGLGSLNAGAQPYYQLSPLDASADFPFADQFNVGIQVFGDINNGNFDNRTFAKTFCREFGKQYSSSSLADTGVSETGAKKVNFLISNADDLKIQAPDAVMTSAPYDLITVDFYTISQQRDIGGTLYDFNVIINGNNANLEDIYTKVQYLLRQDTNINSAGTAGTKIGKINSELLSFVGNTLVTSTAVYIDNIQTQDNNRIEFNDAAGITRANPFVATGIIEFNENLQNDSSASYWMFYRYTVRTTPSNIVSATVSGRNVVFTTTSGTTNLPPVSVNQYVNITGFSDNSRLNGVYRITSVTDQTTGGIEAYKISLPDKAPLTNESSTAGTISFEENPNNSPDAIIVEDASGTPITGTISGANNVIFSYDYDNNSQGNRITGQGGAAVIVKAIGFDTAQFVETTGSITRTTGQTFSLISALERNFL